MSYSRWLESCWYSFATETREGIRLCFCACGVPKGDDLFGDDALFSAEEIRTDKSACVERLKAIATWASDDELAEAAGIMDLYLKDEEESK